jgi:hypothetical protein
MALKKIKIEPEPLTKHHGYTLMVYQHNINHGTGFTDISIAEMWQLYDAIQAFLNDQEQMYVANVRKGDEYYMFGPISESDRADFTDKVNLGWRYPTIIWTSINPVSTFDTDEAVAD